jgi:alpha-beta hydrolase superfamily lysophospholipase
MLQPVPGKMKTKASKWLKKILITITCIYLSGGAVLYFCQELILFHPQSLPRDHHFNFDQIFHELNISFHGDNVNMIRFPADSPSKGIILFYHGNMKNIEHYAKYPSLFTTNHYELWMIDYPGFGKTTGKRSEEKIYEQALLMYDSATKNQTSRKIIVYGKSIGTGVASYVSSKRKCHLLILETPYRNIQTLSRHYFPIYPSFLLKYTFPNDKHLETTKAPVVIFHGTEDEIVPCQESKKLKKIFPSIELITNNQCRHNDLFEFDIYKKKMDSLLKLQ